MVGETAKRELMGEFPNQIIRASAGTGKTFALSNRYLRLLASGAECQTILATTFTRKGAGEILDRIIGRLSDAALDEDAATKLSKELDFVVNKDRAAKILYDLIANLHRLEISTLDSFFNKVAKAFALELGLPPTWEIVDEQLIGQMEDEAIQSVLRDESVLNLLHMLSKGEASRRVASMVRDTVRNVYEVFRESGSEPWDQIPAVGQFLPKEELELVLAKIESVQLPGKQLPKHWQEVKGYARTGDWAGFASTKSFQNVLAGISKYGNSKLKPEMLEIYSKILPHCQAYISHRLIQQNHSTRDLLTSFGEILERRKDETGALRFDDVTERLQDFVSMWTTDRFSFRLDHQIQHLLLDEFQDTSLAQWNVIRPFANAVTENPDNLRSFFCVGDMKQAIFGWRGGVAEIFDLVDDQLPNLEPTQKLTASYRSSQPVIDLVNNVFENVKKYACNDDVINEAIYQWTNWFETHSTNREDLPGYVSVEMAADCDNRVKGIEHVKDNDRNRKVTRKTVERIRTLLRRIPEHHSIGVIVRTNNEVRDLIGRLLEAGISASEEGGTSITDSAAVELILSAITLADHPGDSIARFHVSHSPLGPRFGLEPETNLNQKENAEAVRSAATELRSQLISDGYGQTVEALARVLIDHCTERETLRLQHLVRVAYDSPLHNDQWQLRPIRFVEFIREEVKVSDQSSARVRVMTIHKAKGLEFDVVVLPMKLTTQGWSGMTPNVVVGRQSPTDPIEIATRYANKNVRKLLPPNFQKLFDDDRQSNVREAMCVAYVALTRSVHATHVVVSHGAKSDHQSTAGILLATLCPTAERAEGILYEHGDPDWFKKTKKSESGNPFDLGGFYLPENSDWQSSEISKEIRSGRGLSRVSPSQMEGGSTMRLGTIFETHDNDSAVTRGRLLHGCFEKVAWLDEAVPRKDDLEKHLRKIDPTIADFDPYIAEFYQMIDGKNLKNLLSRSIYSETYLMEFSDPEKVVMEANRLAVFNERRFAVKLDSGIAQGTIDRLVLVYQGNEIIGADVVDFKSDRVNGDNLQGLIEFYRPQLAAYREAVSKFLMIPMEKISTRLAFLETGQIVNLEMVEVSVADASKKQQQATSAKFASGHAKTARPKSNTFAAKMNTKSQTSPLNAPKHLSKPSPKDSKQQKTFWD